MAIAVNPIICLRFSDSSGHCGVSCFHVSPANAAPGAADSLVSAIAACSTASLLSGSVETLAVVPSPASPSVGPYDMWDLLRLELSIPDDSPLPILAVPAPLETMFIGPTNLDVTNGTLLSALPGLLPSLRSSSGTVPIGVLSGKRTRRQPQRF